LTVLCGQNGSAAARDAALDAQPKPGPLAARAGVSCVGGKTHALPAFEALLTEACTADGEPLKTALVALGHRTDRAPEVKATLPRWVAPCPVADRRALLGAVVGSVPDEGALRTALASTDGALENALPSLDLDDHAVRRALLGALATSAQPAPLVDALVAKPLALTPDEEKLLVQAYIANTRPEARVALLDRLRTPPLPTSAWRPLIEAEGKTAAASEERLALRLGLIAIGKREYAAAVVPHLAGQVGAATLADARSGGPALVAYTLTLAGCTPEEIKNLAEKAATAKPNEAKRGTLCTKPAR
jgi:hypothetical protein